MNPLARLSSLLNSGQSQPLARPWAVERTIDGHLSKLEQQLKSGASSYVPHDLQEEAVRRFWTNKRIDSFRDAQLVSHGVALPIGPQRLRVMEDSERFPVLLNTLDQYLPAPRKFRRCYQGLLKGYFAYDYEVKDAPKVGVANWNTLRSYLAKHSGNVLHANQNPQWAETLQQHVTLFGLNPCERYGPALLAGNSREVDDLREVLGISDGSWFMRKLFLAQVQAGVKKGDAEFLDSLYRLLELLQTNEVIRNEGLILVLNRFAQLRPPPLVTALRDAAVTWWGNPWLDTNAMWKHKDLAPEAKALVTEWLKLEFITAFFTLLAEENTGDDRRLKFWARYVNTITDIRFALGSEAQSNSSQDFQKLRKKMAGLVVPLSDNVRSNNAFIMRMGSLVVVEFSGYSNACYGYDARRELPFRYDMPVVMPVDGKNSLKHSMRELYLRHQDGIQGYEHWEDRFEAELETKFGVRPKSGAAPQVILKRPATPTTAPPVGRTAATPSVSVPPTAAGKPAAATALNRGAGSQTVANWKTTAYSKASLSLFAAQFGLGVEDFTSQNGNLWIRTDDSHVGINEVLLRWGFEYKNAKKGWWYKGR